MRVTRTFDGAFVAFDTGIVSRHPHHLDIARGENLHGLEKFAGSRDSHLFEANAPILVYFAGDGDFFYGVGFCGIVHGAHGAHAGHQLLHHVQMMFHLRKATNYGNERQMLRLTAARAGGQGMAAARKHQRHVRK